jgi:hypothetical protein
MIGNPAGQYPSRVVTGKTAAPTVNDDITLGYTPGSRWIDETNDKEYVCLNNADGAAVWTETTGGGGGGGGGGAWTRLAKVTAASDTTVEFTSNIDGTYSSYLLLIEEFVPETDATVLQMRVSNDGGSTYHNSNYNFAGIAYSPAASSFRSGTGSSHMPLFTDLGSAHAPGTGTGEYAAGWIFLGNFQNASAASAIRAHWGLQNNNGHSSIIQLASTYDTAEANDAIELKCASGDFSGIFTLYGIDTAA